MWRRDKEKNESEIEHFGISREFTPLTIVLAIVLAIVLTIALKIVGDFCCCITC